MWVFLLLVCSVNFFDIVPITRLIGINGPFAFYLLSLFLMFTFNRKALIGESMQWLVPLWWFLFGVVLSFIPAQIYYGQSFLQSFFTYRRFFELSAFPILIALRPNEKELRTSLYAFAVLYLLLCLIVTFIAPSLIVIPDKRKLVEDGDYIHVLAGIRHVFLAFVFALNRAVRQGSLNRPEPDFSARGHLRVRLCPLLDEDEFPETDHDDRAVSFNLIDVHVYGRSVEGFVF